jgi:ubiquinone/menaquinone biosynthesis C-methylase UbiE
MDYIHGYSTQEQERLIQQAQYWRSQLILKDLNYAPEDSLLEIGCGVGAVLGILGTVFPHLQLAGIDLQESQINYARQHLQKLGLSNVDLQVGNGSQLPWQDSSFNHVYAIWFIEHLSNPQQVLKEACRVLKVGGTITLTETDYRTILISPPSPDYDYLQTALSELLLQANGNPYVGQSLGNLLADSGFKKIKNIPIAVHHSVSNNRKEFKGFIDYIDSWLAPTIPQMVEKLGKNKEQLLAGLKWFHQLSEQNNGAITVVIYRASGIKK